MIVLRQAETRGRTGTGWLDSRMGVSSSRLGDDSNAFVGGYRLWAKPSEKRSPRRSGEADHESN
jgi:hypothetical protein